MLGKSLKQIAGGILDELRATLKRFSDIRSLFFLTKYNIDEVVSLANNSGFNLIRTTSQRFVSENLLILILILTWKEAIYIKML